MAEITDAPQGEDLLIEIASVQAASRDPVPEGYYDVVIKQSTPAKAKTSGEPMWKLQLGVINHQEFNNKPLFDIVSFAEGGKPFAKEKLLILAPELVSDPSRKLRFAADAATLVGRKGRVRVTTEEYDGRMMNRVKEWMPLTTDGSFMGDV